MGGKHVRLSEAPQSRGPLRPGRSRAWMGTREVFVFVAIGIALPMALLVSPRLFNAGEAMTAATACDAGTSSNCLEAVPARVSEETTGEFSVPRTWRLQEESGDWLSMTFPRSQAWLLNPGDEVHALFWNGEPVGALRADGRVVESVVWGPLNEVSVQVLLVAPLWALFVVVASWILLWRLPRVRNKLWMLSIIGLGAAAAGPSAYVGMSLRGHRGLVGWGLAPIGLAFLAAGVWLWVGRSRAKSPVLRRAPAKPRATAIPRQPAPPRPGGIVPAQRTTPATLESLFGDRNGDER